MEDSQKKAIELLKKHLQDEDFMLFTGAGYSLGANNGNNEPLPSGNTLKKELLTKILDIDKNSEEFGDLIKEKLSEVISYCYDKVPQNRINDFLTERFKDCTAEEYHKTIANFPWKKVFTVNIDDVFENAIKPNRLIVQNMHRLQSNSRAADKLQYYKLHGCVRNPSGGYIFSSEDYNTEAVSRASSPMHVYACDIQTNNFIFLGFDYSEMDIDVYMRQYSWRHPITPGGKIYFINPSHSTIFKNKVEKLKATLIDITTEEFAKILSSVTPGKNHANANSSLEINGFNLVNLSIAASQKSRDCKSRLLFGEYPQWKDFTYDWDFKHPVLREILDYIDNTTSKSTSSKVVVSLYGNMLIGKTVLLKRIGFELTKEDFQVYEISQRDFDINHFVDKCSRSQIKKIALLVDNAPFFYPTLSRALGRFPKDKHLVIVTAGRTLFHFRQSYAFRQIDNYAEFCIKQFADKYRIDFAKEIDNTLCNKGLLGYLQTKDPSERIQEIIKVGDVCSLLYKLTDSVTFKNKFIDNYTKNIANKEMSAIKDVLLALAIFQELDIPSFPLEILTLWKTDKYQHIMKLLGDYIRYTDDNSIVLRNNFITKLILDQSDERLKIKTLSQILILIAPYRPSYGKNIWSMMQERLMGFRTLKKILKISLKNIEKLYSAIMESYNTDFNYWIHVGIADQEKKDFPSAHNHLIQAENLNNRSYLVKHAIARNYLLRALSNSEKSFHEENYAQGRALMLKLIDELEYDQTKAYSVHSYVRYSIKYWRKYNIRPTKEEIKKMTTLLKSLNASGQDDLKTAEAEKALHSYLRENNMPVGMKLKWNELASLKALIKDEGINSKDIIDDEIPES